MINNALSFFSLSKFFKEKTLLVLFILDFFLWFSILTIRLLSLWSGGSYSTSFAGFWLRKTVSHIVSISPFFLQGFSSGFCSIFFFSSVVLTNPWSDPLIALSSPWIVPVHLQAYLYHLRCLIVHVWKLECVRLIEDG